MGAKDLKNRQHTTLSIDNELFDFLTDYSKKTGIPKSRLVDIGLKLLKEKVKKGDNLFA